MDLDPASGEVLPIADQSVTPEGNEAEFYWFKRLHFGDFGEWPVKGLGTAFGLTPALMFVTGTLMWWNRVLSKKWAKRRLPAASLR